MKDRDRVVDYLRALAMIQVIIVHVFYWGDFISDTYINLIKSWFLFEMPLFFFIIGASNSFKDIGNYFEFVRKRFVRILIPYWIFAVICIILNIYMYCKIFGTNMDFIMDIVISWLIPWDKQITVVPYLNWALWFVPVYLCIVLIIPILKHMKSTKYKYVTGALIVAIFVGMELLHMEWIKNIVFYSLWIYIGLFYNEIKEGMGCREMRRKSRIWLCMNIFGIVVLYYAGYSLDMQYNKFPPNMIFMLYAFVIMTLIMLRISFLKNVFEALEKNVLLRKCIKLFSTRSMTIFLYQVFAFNVSIPVTSLLIPSVELMYMPIKLLLCWSITMLICIGFGIVFGKIEDVAVLLIHSKKNQGS